MMSSIKWKICVYIEYICISYYTITQQIKLYILIIHLIHFSEVQNYEIKYADMTVIKQIYNNMKSISLALKY